MHFCLRCLSLFCQRSVLFLLTCLIVMSWFWSHNLISLASRYVRAGSFALPWYLCKRPCFLINLFLMVQFNPLGMSQSFITSLTLMCLHHLSSVLNWQPEQLSTEADNRLYLVFQTANRLHAKQALFLLLPIADALSSCHIMLLYSSLPAEVIYGNTAVAEHTPHACMFS